MKKIISFYIVILLISNAACGQSTKSKVDAYSSKAVKVMPQYSKVDFFKDQKKLFCWSGSIPSYSTKRFIPQISLISYKDFSHGQCKIICYPKAGISQWESFIKTIKSPDLSNKAVRKITVDTLLQKQYDIYGFFVEAKNLRTEADLDNKDAKTPDFPCPVWIYKRVNNKWLLIKKVEVNNWNNYADVQFDTISGVK